MTASATTATLSPAAPSGRSRERPRANGRHDGKESSAKGGTQRCVAPSTTVELYPAMDTTFWLPQAEAALAGCVKSTHLRHSLPMPEDGPPERETWQVWRTAGLLRAAY